MGEELNATAVTAGSLLGDRSFALVDVKTGKVVMTTLPQGDLPRDLGILRTAVQHNQAHVGVYAMVIHGGTIRRDDILRLT